MSHNSEILIIWHLGGVVGTCSKGLQDCLYIATVVPSDPLSSTASASSLMKTPENTEEDPDNPELAGGGDI